MPPPRLLALLALVLVALLCPAAARAVPDPSIVARDAALIDDGLTAFSQRSGPTDVQYFADGTWVSASPTWWAYTQGGPASAAAVLWRYGGQTRTDLYAMSVAAIDRAIATHQRADGAFTGDAGDNQGPGITTNMYARELGVAYLALEPRLDAAHKASWQSAIARAADYLIGTGEVSWYTNGNIELGEIELLYLASRITGQPRFAAAYEADWAFTLAPPLPRWTGFGLQQSPDGTGYLAEAGTGAPGFDAEYTGVQLDVLTRLWVLSRDPRALRLMNLEVDKLLPRVDAAWQLDTSNGTRHVEAARKVPFLTQALSVLAGDQRPDLASPALAQWPAVEQTYRGTYRYTSVTFYKGLGGQLATTLLAAMSAGGSLAQWLPAAPGPAAAPAPAATTPPQETPAPAASAPAKATTKTAPSGTAKSTTKTGASRTAKSTAKTKATKKAKATKNARATKKARACAARRATAKRASKAAKRATRSCAAAKPRRATKA
jgi:hypothetical protein